MIYQDSKSSFDDAYRIAFPYTIVTKIKCEQLYRLGLITSYLSGSVAECGVYGGGSALILAETAGLRQLHLFDSFRGLSEPCHKDNYHRKGEFGGVKIDDIRRLFSKYTSCKIYQGWIPEVLAPVKNDEFSLVHIDVDLYEPTLSCCEFFYPKLQNGGIIVFDDYGYPDCAGATAAVNEYFGAQAGDVVIKENG